MKITITIILALFTINNGVCQNEKLKNEYTINEFLNKEVKTGFIKRNPLIIYNGVPINKFKNINKNNIILKKKFNYPSSFPHNSKIMNQIFGDDANEGVISVEDRILLYCKKPPQTLWIVDDEIVNPDIFIRIEPKKIKKYSELNWVKRKNDSVYAYSHIYFIKTKTKN